MDNAVARGARRKVEATERTWKGTAFSLKPARAVAARRMRSKTRGAEAREEHYPVPLPADRSLGGSWRRSQGHAGSRDRLFLAAASSLRASQNLCAGVLSCARRPCAGISKVKADIHHVHVIGAGGDGRRHRRMVRAPGPDG